MTAYADFPEAQEVFVLPPQVVEYPVSDDNPWVRGGRCIACEGKFIGQTYFSVSFRPRHRAGPPYYSGIGMDACSRECAVRLSEKLPGLHLLRTEGRPTDPELRRSGWIHAFRKVGDYPEDTERSGKWMVFWEPDEVDAAWMRIRDAIQTGRLGYEAKVATTPARWAKGSYHVTCIYTYDSEDVDDVRRVRWELQQLGVTWRIGYKEDAETAQGHYSGGGRVSKYWE